MPTLYAHPPASLIPLLESQLPQSLVFLGTILANRHADTDPYPPRISADGDRTPISPSPDCPPPPPLPPVYATFPPPPSGPPSVEYLESLGIGPYEWLVTVALPEPSEQIRLYHSLVARPTPEEAAEGATAERVVEAALRFMVKQYPEQQLCGATHERWEPVARGVLGGKRQVPTYVYVAPGSGFGHTEVKGVPPEAEWGGLVLDHGRESDKSLIFSVNHYRVEEYYGARAAHITALRPGPKAQRAENGLDGAVPAPEVFVQCHGDGSLGALHTQPEYRRRGLAKVVLAAHFRRYEGIVPQFCYIEPDNAASIALFEGLGWTPLPWATYWVFEKSVQE